MTNHHHHPESWRDKPPTPNQQRCLRTLAFQKRETFVPPRTRGEASDRISELKKTPTPLGIDRHLDDRAVSDALTARCA